MSAMESSSTTFPSQTALATLLAVSLLAIFVSVLLLYMLLVQIELQTTLSFGEAAEMENDMQLEESSSDGAADRAKSPKPAPSANDNNNLTTISTEDGVMVSRGLHLPLRRRAMLAAVVALITFMTYLLLARSNARAFLSWIGMLVVLGVLLHQTAVEEALQRERVDRLAAIFSLVVVLAMAMNLAVYANRQHAQGDIYEGKARIVDFDVSSYTQNEDDSITRSDLYVAWGGSWGCPNDPDQACEAFVSGALCEAEDDADGVDDLPRARLLSRNQGFESIMQQSLKAQSRRYRRRTRRQLQDAPPASEIEQDAEHFVDEVKEAVGEEVDEESEASEDPATKNAELQKENQALQQQNTDLQKKNEELQNELDEYKQFEAAEESEVEAEEEEYYFDDDNVYDEYWQETEWGGVWGEYSCGDLFDSDLSGKSFDNDEPPGSDDWPFINIYGNCNTCEAFIVDYYSTEHFQSILSYKTTALNYGVMAALCLAVTGYLFYRELVYGGKKTGAGNAGKSAEKEIELLPTVNGAMA